MCRRDHQRRTLNLLPSEFQIRLGGWARFGLGAAFAGLAACSLPTPDGLEAELLEAAAARAPIAEVSGSNANAVVLRGLTLSPEVRAAAAEVDADADQIRIERAAYFSRIGVSLGGGVGDASEDFGVELRASQIVTDGGRTTRAVSVADIVMQISVFAFWDAVDTSIIDALTAYDEVYTQSRLLGLRREQLTTLQDLERRIAERVESGASPRSDIVETGITVSAARFDVVDVELRLGEARDRLAKLTGQLQGGAIPTLEVTGCIAETTPHEVQVASLELDKAVLELRDAEAARLPSVVIEPLVRRGEGDGGLRGGLDVSVNSDFLQGGALSAAVDAAEDRRAAAAADLAAIEREETLEAQTRLRETAVTERRTKLLEEQIALLDEARGLYRNQYLDLGTRSLNELLDNEEEFYDRQAELLETRAELRRDRLNCVAREDRLASIFDLDTYEIYGLPVSAN